MSVRASETHDIPLDVIVPLSCNNGKGNAIGLPGGAYGFQMEFAKFLHSVTPGAHGTIDPAHLPDLRYTEPAVHIPEQPIWNDPKGIVSFQAKGHRAVFERALNGYRALPTIAVTRSSFQNPAIVRAMERGLLSADNEILHPDGSYTVTDVNIDPVWHLEGVAERIGTDVDTLRICLNNVLHLPELIDRTDVPYFLPPMDGPNIHIFGDASRLASSRTEIGARSHDFCRDGDNYALRCTCAPFRDFAIEELIKIAQAGGIGLLVLYPEEGRNLGSVIKHLVYNKRARQPGGDIPERYMACTNEVAGGEDARMHWTKPDVYRWLLGAKPKIDHWLSENPHKKKALQEAGITVNSIVSLPECRIPERARTEITAKRVHGGYSGAPMRPPKDNE